MRSLARASLLPARIVARVGLRDLLKRRAPTQPAASARGRSGRGHSNGFLELEEVNVDLQGRAGLDVFDRMYRTDPDVRRNVTMVAAPIIGGTWTVDPHGGDEATDQDRKVADDVAWALGIGDHGPTSPLRPRWAGHLAEAVPLAVRSGFTPFEVVWTKATRDGRTLLAPRTFDVRLPRSIYL